MKRPTLGSVVFFLIAPGSAAGLVPWLLRSGDHRPSGAAVMQAAGWLVVVLGLVVAIAAFTQFVREGRGTPAPIAPTERLVVGGLYRWTRNPMYEAVAAMIAGQALLFETARSSCG